MNRDVLVSALATVFGALAATLVFVGLATEPVVLILAVPFGVVAYAMWYQSSGRLGRRVYRQVEQAGRVEDRRHRAERVRRGQRDRGAGPGSPERAGPERAGPERAGPERGGFGAGPREDWEPQGAWARRVREERRRERARAGATSGERRARDGRDGRDGRGGPSRREACEVLGVEPGADEETIRRAYRERVKTVHPDAKTGDEEAFKRLTAAYERLTD